MTANNSTANQPTIDSEIDEARAINHLLAINVMIEAARLGHEAAEFASLTEAMALVAPDWKEGRALTKDLFEKQAMAANNLQHSSSAKQTTTD